MRQRAVIKKLLQNKAEVSYKVRQEFNIVLAIKKCDCYYKVCQVLQSVTNNSIKKFGL